MTKRLSRYKAYSGFLLMQLSNSSGTGHDVITELYTGFRHEIHNYAEIKDEVADGIIEFMDDVLGELE